MNTIFYRRLSLILIILSVILGSTAGYFIGKPMMILMPIGTFFIYTLKLLIDPLIFTSIIIGIMGLPNIKKLGKLGAKTILYFAVTTSIAVIIGIILVSIIEPGKNIHANILQGELQTHSTIIKTQSKSNWIILLEAFTSKTLLIVYSSIIIGIFCNLHINKTTNRFIHFNKLCNHYILRLVNWILLTAPIAIFCLLSARFGQAGGGEAVINEIMKVGMYCLTVLLGLSIHSFLVLLPILYFIAKRNPIEYLKNLLPAFSTAFSTASSSATMPITIDCLEHKNKISNKAVGLVIPVGTTINMNGTALYEAVAAIFIAQAYGIDLSITTKIIVFITATLAAMGAGGIPEAGLVMMTIVLQAVGLPLEGTALIIGIDWFLDRYRTVTNVWGECVGAAVIDRSYKKEFENK